MGLVPSDQSRIERTVQEAIARPPGGCGRSLDECRSTKYAWEGVKLPVLCSYTYMCMFKSSDRYRMLLLQGPPGIKNWIDLDLSLPPRVPWVTPDTPLSGTDQRGERTPPG